MQEAQLIKKIKLTSDVFELHYQSENKITMLPGQFVTFILPEIGGRAYSILKHGENSFVLILKRWSKENGGRGGSIHLCDAEIGAKFRFVGPAGHFLLKDTPGNKLFLGTGTGLVPLYNQILAGLSVRSGVKYQLVFGVRTREDLFYVKEFAAIKKLHPDTFYYHLVTSRSEGEGLVKQGYVTDFLSAKVVSDFDEYYLCGAPGMIDSCKEMLHDFGVNEGQIYFEKY